MVFSLEDSKALVRGCTGVEWCGWESLYGSLSAAKYRFANGLTWVFMPDFRAPLFTYQTWFRVGSKHENPQVTGLAHFFEHLMFKGTQTFPLGTFDRAMEMRGAQTNAATWVDWTFYTQSLSAQADHLETVAHFESDRMLHLALTEEVFLSELEVVKNERRLTVEDSPAGLVAEHIAALAYPSHGYGRPTIGHMQHLEQMTLQQAQDFYRTYYIPQRATVVLCGALDPATALKTMQTYYAPLQPLDLSKHVHMKPEEQTYGPAASRILDGDVLQTHLTVAFPAPAQNTPDYPVAEVLAEILLEGDSGRLYQSLVVDQRLVSEVSGGITPYAEPGLFEFHMLLRQGVSVEKAVKALQKTLDALQKGLEPYELNKAKHALELTTLEQWGETETAAEALGHYETCFHSFEAAFRMHHLYPQVTAQSVLNLAKSLFLPSRRYVAAAVPGKEKGVA
jgi:zinc protease